MDDPFCPHAAAARLGVTVIPTRLDRALGYTDGCGRIWLDPRQTQVQLRCTLAHELFHVIHGHVGRQSASVEHMVRRATARWLVPWPDLVAAVGDQLHLHDLAEALDVTPEVLADRITHATDTELSTLEGRTQWASVA